MLSTTPGQSRCTHCTLLHVRSRRRHVHELQRARRHADHESACAARRWRCRAAAARRRRRRSTSRSFPSAFCRDMKTACFRKGLSNLRVAPDSKLAGVTFHSERLPSLETNLEWPGEGALALGKGLLSKILVNDQRDSCRLANSRGGATSSSDLNVSGATVPKTCLQSRGSVTNTCLFPALLRRPRRHDAYASPRRCVRSPRPRRTSPRCLRRTAYPPTRSAAVAAALLEAVALSMTSPWVVPKSPTAHTMRKT